VITWDVLMVMVVVVVYSETLSVTSFHYVQVNLQTYYDSMLQNRKEAPRWSRRFQRPRFFHNVDNNK